jgi:hypothetical protein
MTRDRTRRQRAPRGGPRQPATRAPDGQADRTGSLTLGSRPEASQSACADDRRRGQERGVDARR